MKTAILLIYLLQGGMTSQIVPADNCEKMAQQARISAGWYNSVHAVCLYTDPSDQESK